MMKAVGCATLVAAALCLGSNAPAWAGAECSQEVQSMSAQLEMAKAGGMTAQVAGLSEALAALKAHCDDAGTATLQQDVQAKEQALLESQDALAAAKAKGDQAAVARAQHDVQDAQTALAEAEAKLKR